MVFTRGGNFNPFTNGWVNLGSVLSQKSQIKKLPARGMGLSQPKSNYNPLNVLNIIFKDSDNS